MFSPLTACNSLPGHSDIRRLRQRDSCMGLWTREGQTSQPQPPRGGPCGPLPSFLLSISSSILLLSSDWVERERKNKKCISILTKATPGVPAATGSVHTQPPWHRSPGMSRPPSPRPFLIARLRWAVHHLAFRWARRGTGRLEGRIGLVAECGLGLCSYLAHTDLYKISKLWTCKNQDSNCI